MLLARVGGGGSEERFDRAGVRPALRRCPHPNETRESPSGNRGCGGLERRRRRRRWRRWWWGVEEEEWWECWMDGRSNFQHHSSSGQRLGSCRVRCAQLAVCHSQRAQQARPPRIMEARSALPVRRPEAVEIEGNG
ncbi:unnamed protein product [Lampetra fluviatilis]